MAKTEEFIKRLPELAWEYIQECMNHTKHVAGSGSLRKVGDRHIPTIQYFLRIWLPLNNFTEDQIKAGKLKGDTMTRSTWYKWLSSTDGDGKKNEQSDTIKEINETFRCLAEDIVANEGKGIFYAKNRLGMTDKMEHAGNEEQPLFGKDVNK